jgi:hypothetical protein
MLSNLNPSARVGVVGVIDPDAYAAGTYTTGWIDMQDYFSVLAVVLAGDLGASATINAKIEQATTSAGTGAKDVTGSAITALTQAGADDNKQVAINLFQADLDRNNGYRWVRLSMTIGTATSDAGAVVVSLDTRYGAATAADAATVDEIVS